MTTRKLTTTVFLVLLTLVMLTACRHEGGQEEAPPVVLGVANESTTQGAPAANTEDGLEITSRDWRSAFEDTLQYYIDLQIRANTTSRYEEQIFLETVAINNPFPETIIYAFFDVSGSGVPELIIGTENEGILRIYALQNGEPVLLIGPATSHFRLNLLEDTTGNVVIEHARRRQFYEIAEFYRIDGQGELVILDVLMSHGTYFEDDTNRGKVIDRERVVHGEMSEMLLPFPETEVISEEAYVQLIEMYGSGGWLLETHESYEDRLLAQRLVELDWESVSSEEHHISSPDVPIRFYYLCDDNGGAFIYDHQLIYLSEEHFITDLNALINRYFGHYYQFDLEINENRLYVTHEWPTVDRGGLSSHQTATGLNTLLLTFSSIPNIDEIVFINDGFGKVMFENDGLIVVEDEIQWIQSRFEVR